MKDFDKFLWVMFWWAIGDAFWVPIEFFYPWDFEPVDVVNWKIWLMEYWKDFWDWSDDTAMALLLADSLIRCGWTDIIDQLENYYKRHKTWYMGLRPYPDWEWWQVARMLELYWEYKDWILKDKPWEEDRSGKRMDWNGSLMRIWPVPLYFYDNIKDVLIAAKESCYPTHNTDLCIDSCVYYSRLIHCAMQWIEKKQLLNWDLSYIKWFSKNRDFSPEVLNIIKWSYFWKISNEVNPSWYVVDSLEVALWGFYHSNSFWEWLKMVLDLWWDTDTTWCIYWYLAWAYYWYDNIPERLKEWLAERDRIEKTAKLLYNANL